MGGQGWPDDLVGASLSLAMLSWVPLTVCDVCSVTLTHPCSHMTMTTIDFVRRHSAHTAVLLYCGLYCNTARILLYWTIQPTHPVPRPLNSNTAIQRHTAPYSHTAIHHNTVYNAIQSTSAPLSPHDREYAVAVTLYRGSCPTYYLPPCLGGCAVARPQSSRSVGRMLVA